MKRQHKNMIKAGIVLIVVGLIAMIIGFVYNGGKWNGDYEMNTFNAEKDYTGIDVKLEAGTVKTEFYDGEKITVDYPVGQKYDVTLETRGETLVIKCELKWFAHFGINFGWDFPTTVIKLPQGVKYGVQINLNAGEIDLADGEYGAVNLDMDAGTLSGNNIECASFNCKVNAGTVKLNKLGCQSLDCDMNAGTLKIEDTSAATIKIDMDAGTVKMGINGKDSEYTVTQKVSAGSCNLSNRIGTTDKTIDVKLSAGSATFNFLQ